MPSELKRGVDALMYHARKKVEMRVCKLSTSDPELFDQQIRKVEQYADA